MSQYLTPLKENNLNTTKNNKNMTQPRQGDWICLNCHNLNFSFRKKCNRCKVQTRQINQQVNAYYLQYYPKNYYFQQQKQNFPTIDSYGLQMQNGQNNYFYDNLSAKQYKTHEKQSYTPQKQKRRQELPSVSPLLKRYNRYENQSTQQSKNNGLFEDKSVWANININYLQQPQLFDSSDEKFLNNDMEEIQKIIQNIML